MDVIPIKGGRWIARCAECGRATPFDEQAEAWQWLLEHPCDDLARPSGARGRGAVVDDERRLP